MEEFTSSVGMTNSRYGYYDELQLWDSTLSTHYDLDAKIKELAEDDIDFESRIHENETQIGLIQEVLGSHDKTKIANDEGTTYADFSPSGMEDSHELFISGASDVARSIGIYGAEGEAEWANGGGLRYDPATKELILWDMKSSVLTDTLKITDTALTYKGVDLLTDQGYTDEEIDNFLKWDGHNHIADQYELTSDSPADYVKGLYASFVRKSDIASFPYLYGSLLNIRTLSGTTNPASCMQMAFPYGDLYTQALYFRGGVYGENTTFTAWKRMANYEDHYLKSEVYTQSEIDSTFLEVAGDRTLYLKEAGGLGALITWANSDDSVQFSFYLDPSESDLFVLMNQNSDILLSSNPSGVVYVRNHYTSSETDSAISTALSSYYTSSETDSAISTALSSYYTSSETDSAISTALSSYYTSSETDSAISTALSSYYTSSQTDSAISTALSSYYTSSQTDSAISTALSSYYTSSETDSAISTALSSYYTSSETDSAISTALSSYYTSGETDTAISNLEILHKALLGLTATEETEGLQSALVSSGSVPIPNSWYTLGLPSGIYSCIMAYDYVNPQKVGMCIFAEQGGDFYFNHHNGTAWQAPVQVSMDGHTHTESDITDLQTYYKSGDNISVGTITTTDDVDITNTGSSAILTIRSDSVGTTNGDSIIKLRETQNEYGFDIAYKGDTDNQFKISRFNNPTETVVLEIDKDDGDVYWYSNIYKIDGSYSGGDGHCRLYFNRTSSSYENCIRWQSGGSSYFFEGLDDTETNWKIYTYGGGGNSLEVAYTSGDVTVKHDLNVEENLTVDGDLTVSGSIDHTPIYWEGYKDTQQNLTSTWSFVHTWTERASSGTWTHKSESSDYKYWSIPVDGVFLISFDCTRDNISSDMMLCVEKNSTSPTTTEAYGASDDTARYRLTGSAVIPLDAGDTIHMSLYDGGTGYTPRNTSVFSRNNMAIVRLGSK